MPIRAPRRCTSPGCGGRPAPGSGKCSGCRGRQYRESDLRRGSPQQRGYGPEHREFRERVLERDPVCVLCEGRSSVIADHWPLSRRQLVAKGLDPNDPDRGRGLCDPCDRVDKSRRQPGGWHRGRRR